MSEEFECEQCGTWHIKKLGCSECESQEKILESDLYEKKLRRKESGYWQNTGKYKKKDKLKATLRW